jgi:hypothetical protein
VGKTVSCEPPSMYEVSESLDNVAGSLGKNADALKKKYLNESKVTPENECKTMEDAIEKAKQQVIDWYNPDIKRVLVEKHVLIVS